MCELSLNCTGVVGMPGAGVMGAAVGVHGVLDGAVWCISVAFLVNRIWLGVGGGLRRGNTIG